MPREILITARLLVCYNIACIASRSRSDFYVELLLFKSAVIEASHATSAA